MNTFIVYFQLKFRFTLTNVDTVINVQSRLDYAPKTFSLVLDLPVFFDWWTKQTLV